MPEDQHLEIKVVPADALHFSTDVLVLKHAQVSLGVDAAAKERLHLDLGINLSPGSQLIVGGRPQLGAGKVIFLGVPPLQEFGYSEIRLFARRAIASVGEEVPHAREVALTLHGAGYGLDEMACFDAELAGLVDAFDLRTGPASLERVIFLEANVSRAERLQRHLEQTFPSRHGSTFLALPHGPGVSERVGRLASSTPVERDHAFVAMPFSEEFEDIFHYGIQPSIHASGLLCERIDQEVFTGDVLARIKQKIRSATLVVADLTGANPNVYLEVGFAWAAEVPTVLLRRRETDLKFDVQGERCLSYASIKDLEERLTGELKQLVS